MPLTRAWDWLKEGVETLAFGNPAYNMMLGGRAVKALPAVPPDVWPGKASQGSAILEGVFTFAGQSMPLLASPQTEAFWQPEEGGDAWYAALHDFHWLRDLRALGTNEARRCARSLVFDWIYCHASWSSNAWAPELVGPRIANWIGLHDFCFASADEGFRHCLFDSIARQTRHLHRRLPGTLGAEQLLAALKGLFAGSLCLADGAGPVLADARQMLEQELSRQILPDGGHIQRNPSLHLALLRDLVDIRSALRAARVEAPPVLQPTIDRMAATLRTFRHGDGGLTLFHGGEEEDPALIDAVLTQADSRSRPLRSATHTGYERLHGGRALVLMDCAGPPPAHIPAPAPVSAPGAAKIRPPRGRMDRRAHAAPLSFEFSIGRDRLVVNCGACPDPTSAWYGALAGTAAHSTLVLAETNAAELLPRGGIGRRPAAVKAQRHETPHELSIVASHDGYGPQFKLLHRRQIHLEQNGFSLHGEDTLEPLEGIAGNQAAVPFVIRFHIHPAVKVEWREGVDGLTPFFILPQSRHPWRFSAEGGVLGQEESIYAGTNPFRPTVQITVRGETVNGPATTVNWAFHREAQPE